MIRNDQENCSMKMFCYYFRKEFPITWNSYYCPFQELKNAERYFVRHCILHGKTPLMPSERITLQ